ETERCTLFVDSGKFDDDLRRQLADDGIELADYAATTAALERLGNGARVLYSPGHVVAAVVEALPAGAKRIDRPNPSTHMKAVKSGAELAHIRATMREDGAALVHGFHAVEQALARGETVTELDVDTILREARAARPGFVSESFGTIAGYM